MKKLLLSMISAAALCFSAGAAEVTFDMTNPSSFGVTPAASGEAVVPTTFSIDPVTVTVTQGAGLSNGQELRFFTNSSGSIDFRCSAKGGQKGHKFAVSTSGTDNITKIEFTATNLNVTAEPGTLSDMVWSGETKTVTFTTTGAVNITKMVVTLGGEVVDPGEPDVVILEDALTAATPNFSIENVVKPEALDHVWAFDSQYGAKASAYVSSTKTTYATEAWLISRVIDLTNNTEVKLNFSHATNNFTNVETAKEEATVWVREQGGEWSQLECDYPTSMSWTFVSSGTIDLSAYDGKKIQIGFKYTSTEAKAGTWEIKNFRMTGQGEAGGTVEPEYEEVSSIDQFLSTAEADVTYKFTNPVSVIYQNGRYLYVQDTTGKLLIYGDLDTKYENGQNIPAGFLGTYSEYNGMGQLAPVKTSFEAGVEGTVIAPLDITLPEITSDLVNTLVKITDVAVKHDESQTGNNAAKYFIMTDTAEATATLFNQFNGTYYDPSVEVLEGDHIDVVGIVSLYKNAPQVLAVSTKVTSGLENVNVDENAPVEYYNLQGIRVANPENGIFVRRQGNTAVKVAF